MSALPCEKGCSTHARTGMQPPPPPASHGPPLLPRHPVPDPARRKARAPLQRWGTCRQPGAGRRIPRMSNCHAWWMGSAHAERGARTSLAVGSTCKQPPARCPTLSSVSTMKGGPCRRCSLLTVSVYTFVPYRTDCSGGKRRGVVLAAALRDRQLHAARLHNTPCACLADGRPDTGAMRWSPQSMPWLGGAQAARMQTTRRSVDSRSAGVLGREACRTGRGAPRCRRLAWAPIQGRSARGQPGKRTCAAAPEHGSGRRGLRPGWAPESPGSSRRTFTGARDRG